MSVVKLAEYFAAKYNLEAKDHHGIDPRTKKERVPKFETGDLVGKEILNKMQKGKYIAPFQGNRTQCLVQWLHKPVGQYSVEENSHLVLLEKKMV